MLEQPKRQQRTAIKNGTGGEKGWGLQSAIVNQSKPSFEVKVENVLWQQRPPAITSLDHYPLK